MSRELRDQGQVSVRSSRSLIEVRRRSWGLKALWPARAARRRQLSRIVVGIAVVIVALPLAGIVAGTYFAAGVPAAVGAGIVAGVIWVAVLLALSGAVSAFTSTFWTLSYTRFDQEPQPLVAGSPLPA